MYRVLMPIDTDTRRAKGQAKTAIRLNDEMAELEVIALHVHEEIDHHPDEGGRSYIDDLNENLVDIQGRPEAFDLAVQQLQDAGVNVSENALVGKPAPAIIELSDEFDVDAILLGVRKRSPVGKVLFGSVTQAVILESDRPILTAPAALSEA